MYSRRVKFIASAAGFFITGALQGGCRIVEDFHSYANPPAYLAKYYSQSDYSLLNFFITQDFKREVQIFSLLFGVGILIGCIAMHYARAERKTEQELRDRLAHRLAAEVERRIKGFLSGSDASPFALYLRPFVLESTIRKWKLVVGSFKMFFLESGRVNFDYFLQAHFNRLDIPLISIGLPDNQEGAGRIITENSIWFERFQQLAVCATTIVVVPGIQTGIMEEIRWLRMSGLLTKTVFFKPRGYPRVEWDKMKGSYQREGIELPEYSSKNLSFRVYPTGRYDELLTWRAKHLKGTDKRCASQMRALLSNKPVKFG